MILNSTGHIRFTIVGRLRCDSGRSWIFWIACGTSRGDTDCITIGHTCLFYSRLIDRLLVQSLTLGLYHKVLRKEIYQIRDNGFGVQLRNACQKRVKFKHTIHVHGCIRCLAHTVRFSMNDTNACSSRGPANPRTSLMKRSKPRG